MATLLTIGCTGSGMAGCGSDGATNDQANVNSNLLGVYAIDSYQTSPLDDVTGDPVPDSCDQLSDSPRPVGADFVVLYAFRPNDSPDESRLGAVFCTSVAECEDVAERQPEPAVGYSFLQGSDEEGWVGFAVSRTGSTGAMCESDVQTHNLTASGQSISINTDVVSVEYEPTMDPEIGDTAICSVRDALAALTPDPPCASRFQLAATRN